MLLKAYYYYKFTERKLVVNAGSEEEANEIARKLIKSRSRSIVVNRSDWVLDGEGPAVNKLLTKERT